MTTTHDVIAPDDLVAETIRDHALALDALRRAVTRNARVWRRISDYERPVPGSTWNAAETAAHLIGDLHDHTEVLIRDAEGGAFAPPTRRVTPPAEASARVNARHLTAVPDRNLHRLAAQLEDAADRYLSIAALADAGAPVITATGLRATPAMMTGMLLGEQLIHGRDIARACERAFTIDTDAALLALPAMLAVAPSHRPGSRTRRPVSFELRVRGGNRYRYALVNGSALVSSPGAPVDCTISADPVALLLVGAGRISQRTAVLHGTFRAGGRRPWRSARFGAPLARP